MSSELYGIRPNRDMLVFDGIKESENHETWNRGIGGRRNVLRETCVPDERTRPAGHSCACPRGGCWRARSTCAASGLVIQAPDLTATPGSSGSFDLLLLNVPGSGSFTVSADQFTLSLSGPLGIHFTDVSIATDPVAAPYIFVSSGTTQPGGPPLSIDSFPNTTFTGIDAEFEPPGFRTLAEGETFGLAHVSYSVDASSPAGTDTLTISPASLLLDQSGAPNAFGIINGSITVASRGARTLGPDAGRNCGARRAGACLAAWEGGEADVSDGAVGRQKKDGPRPGRTPRPGSTCRAGYGQDFFRLSFERICSKPTCSYLSGRSPSGRMQKTKVLLSSSNL